MLQITHLRKGICAHKGAKINWRFPVLFYWVFLVRLSQVVVRRTILLIILKKGGGGGGVGLGGCQVVISLSVL